MATRESNLESGGKSVTVGIDVEEVASFDSINQIFLNRNFSVAEQGSRAKVRTLGPHLQVDGARKKRYSSPWGLFRKEPARN
jgi:hypothetical protein